MADTRLLYSFTTTPNPVVVSIGGDSPVPSNIDLLVIATENWTVTLL